MRTTRPRAWQDLTLAVGDPPGDLIRIQESSMAERAPAATPPGAAAIRFEAEARKTGPWTILRLPDAASAEPPSRGQVAVTGVMNRHAFRTVLEPDGRRGHWLKVDTKLQRAAAVKEGETVAIEVEPTTDWPEPDIPEDFQAALADAPDISELWTQITPMARWEWVRWINATKSPVTRGRRVEVGISKLRSGRRRPCCFDLAACTDPDLSKSGKLVDGT
jgi:predicted RNA-binding protein with TRAM domain